STPGKTAILFESVLPPGAYYSLTLEALPNDSLPNHGPGAAESGNFILTRFRAELLSEGRAAEEIEITSAYATHEQHGWPVAEALQDAPHGDEGENGWAIGGGIGKS